MKLEKTWARPVAIVGGVRLPFCRAGSHYAGVGALDLMTESLKATVAQFNLEGERLGEVALGTVFYPPSTWNFARDAVMKSGLSPETPAEGVQRACATSLDAAIVVAHKIAMGQIESGIAGGSESISNVSLFVRDDLARRIKKTASAKSIKDKAAAWWGLSLGELAPGAPAAVEPSTGKSMGQHCEMMAQTWGITRQEQDELSLQSHLRGIAAYERGFYDGLVAPFMNVHRDNNLRADTSLEKLAKLKPAFDKSDKGTLTAGNSSPLTDGGGCVLLCSEEWAKEHGFKVLAYLVDSQSAAIDLTTEGLLMAPAYAMPRMLKRAGRTLQDFDFYEIHEAFAAQVLCTLKAWESTEFCQSKLGLSEALGKIDRAKLNVVGGSVALGHPFGATGARMLGTMAKLLEEKGSGKGVLSICTGGGMGTVAIMER